MWSLSLRCAYHGYPGVSLMSMHNRVTLLCRCAGKLLGGNPLAGVGRRLASSSGVRWYLCSSKLYSPPEIGLLSSSGRSLLSPVGCSLTQPAILLLSHWLRQPRSLFLFLHWSSDGWQESWSSGSQTAFILQEIVPKSQALLVPGQTIAPRRGVNI